MNRKTSIYAIFWICTALTGLSASAFDGVTNTIPDGTLYDELEIGGTQPNTYINIESNSTVSVATLTRLGADDSSTNNTLQVKDGATLQIGTLTTPSNDGIIIGDTVGDALIIKNASTVESSKLTMGASANETAKIAVKGEDSLLLINKDASIGALGDGNEVNVSGGAKFEVLGLLTVGSTNTADNLINVDSTSTLAVSSLDMINIADNNAIVINGTLEAKGDVSTGTIGARNISMNSGSEVLVDDTLIGDIEGGYAIVLNESATWDPEHGDARIGYTTAGNSLAINNSSDLTITNSLTTGEESNLNTLHIQDDAKLNASTVKIGRSGSFNTLTIEDNAELDMTNDTLTAGINASANSNTINLKDEGSLRASEMTIGLRGNSNKFIQTGGTATILDSAIIGQNGDSNYIQLSNSNSVLSVRSNLTVGAEGNSNKLNVFGGNVSIGNNLYVGMTSNENNQVLVTGDSSLLTITNKLFVGSASSSNNTVTVENGGTLYVGAQTNIVISGTNNTLKITTGTLKTTDWDFDPQTGTDTNIMFGSGATLHLLGILAGTNLVEGGLNFVLDGTNSSWNTGTNELFVGIETDNNSLTITNGATSTTATNLYIGVNSKDNLVLASGTGTKLRIGGDLYIGTETNSSTFNNFRQQGSNTLAILDGATMIVTNDARLFLGATLKIGSTSKVTVLGDYEQDLTSTLAIGISSNQIQPNLVVGGTAAFAKSGNTNAFPMIRVIDEGIAESNVVTIVQAGNITVDGQKATAGAIKANIATNLLLGFNITLSNDVENTYIVLDDFIVRTLGEAAGLSGQLLAVANDIESLTNANASAMLDLLSGNDAATAHQTMENYYGEKMSSIPAHNAINMGIHAVAEQLTKRADNTRARMKEVPSAMSAPAGAQGPHMYNQELQGWITGYKTWADKSADSGFDAYNGSVGGFVLGADFAVEQGIMVGIAAGSGSSTLDKDNGASVDTSTTYGSLYASAGTRDWFADASFIYGGSSVNAKLGSIFDTQAKYDARNIALYLGGGKEITGNYLIITPQASLLGNYYSQESYEETSTTAVARKVGSFDALYLQSAVGCNVAFYSTMGETTVKPEFRAFWLHELNAKEEDLAFSLVDGNGSYNMKLQSPESDIIKLGAGISAKLGEYLEIRADLDSRMASGYSDYTLLGSIRYQF